MNTLLVVTGLVSVALIALWIKTKNHGWVFPIALVLFIAATIKGGVPTWMNVTFGLFIAACVVWFFVSRRSFIVMAFVAAFFAAIVFALVFWGSMPKDTDATTPETTITTTATVSPSIEDRANEVLLANGWEAGQYLLGNDVDPSKDRSTTGSGAFDQQGIKNPAEMMAFLNTGKDSANALLANVMEGTGATREEVLSDSNWIAVQSLIAFTYPGNTMFVDGKVANAGQRDGEAGEIFLLFISPSTNKAVAVRGACVNPQAFIPTPVSSDDGEELEVKDPAQDPAPRGNAPVGGGTNLDPGPGEYIPPQDMVQPPTEPRVNPPAPPAETAIPVGSIPDPTPASAPELLAPAPAVPATGYSPPPGG